MESIDNFHILLSTAALVVGWLVGTYLPGLKLAAPAPISAPIPAPSPAPGANPLEQRLDALEKQLAAILAILRPVLPPS